MFCLGMYWPAMSFAFPSKLLVDDDWAMLVVEPTTVVPGLRNLICLLGTSSLRLMITVSRFWFVAIEMAGCS